MFLNRIWGVDSKQQGCGVTICFWLCVKCVSIDTSSIPPEINPWAPRPFNLPTLSLSPPTMLTQVCVWACVYVSLFTSTSGLRVLYGSTCRGQQKRQLSVRGKQKNVRTRANRHASQDRHFWSEYHHLCYSLSPLHLPPPVTCSCFYML